MPAHASRTLAPARSAPPSRAERRLLAPARPRHRPADAATPAERSASPAARPLKLRSVDSVLPSLAQTLGASVYRYLRDPDRYPFTAGLPDITFEVPAGLQLKVSWDDEAAHQVRLTDVDTDSWLCLDAALLVECGRSVTPGAEHLGPRFDQIAESLRLGRLRD